jgi:hypothetical protein
MLDVRAKRVEFAGDTGNKSWKLTTDEDKQYTISFEKKQLTVQEEGEEGATYHIHGLQQEPMWDEVKEILEIEYSETTQEVEASEPSLAN